MRQTDEQKKAASQLQITALKMKVRRIEQREADAARHARNHRLIVGGAIVEEHALENPAGEFARAYGQLLANESTRRIGHCSPSYSTHYCRPMKRRPF
jgi:2-methylcitrate dehydratase PrpD